MRAVAGIAGVATGAAAGGGAGGGAGGAIHRLSILVPFGVCLGAIWIFTKPIETCTRYLC